MSPYIRDEKEQYYSIAAFGFNLKHYPGEFNFILIEQFGWYDSVNNFEGISRDHMLSRSQGFSKHINPKLLAHPANCELMTHKDNMSKNGSSSLTLEELLERILIWNEKYENYERYQPYNFNLTEMPLYLD